MKNLSINEMKELLSDYSFGKLTDYEKSVFESNIDKYPDIKEEVIEIRNTFSSFNKDSIKENIENKTVNLSYKVNQNQYSKQRNKNLWFSIFKFSVPVLLLGFTYIYIQKNQINNSTIFNEVNSSELVTDVDMNIIIGDAENTSTLNDISQVNTLEVNDGLLITNNNELDELSILENMTESEFNKLLDEISDEKINL